MLASCLKVHFIKCHVIMMSFLLNLFLTPDKEVAINSFLFSKS